MDRRYDSTNELPIAVRKVLPQDAQLLYLRGYQEGWDDYDASQAGDLDRRSIAHRQGWALVEHEFVCHQGTGKWYHRGQEPTEEELQAGLFGRLRGLFRRGTD
jgi:cation transport regulator ChaB